MGLDHEAGAQWHPTDDFPAPVVPDLDRAQLAMSSVSARPDVQAAKEAVAASAALYEGADHNTLPALDLNVAVGYSGALDDDGLGPFVESLGSNLPGVSGGASLTLELPVGNRAQSAARALAHAQHSADVIARDDLIRNVRSQVLAALDALRLSAATLQAAHTAEALFVQALEDERVKMRAGLSTVIDVVLTEERLTQAQLSRVQSQLAFAVALAQLRSVTGELPATEADMQHAKLGTQSPEVVHVGR
jgi:outer membrane protein TolC